MEKLDSVLFFTLEKVIKVYRRFAQQQISKNGYNITIDQWLVLRALQENSQLSQKEIAEILFKDFASITRIVELLVKSKYIKRSINKVDRRKFELIITPLGLEMIDKIYPIVIDYRKKALNGLEISELQHLQKKLEQIVENIS